MVERVEDNFQAYGAFTLPWFQSSTIQLVQKHHSLQNCYFIPKKAKTREQSSFRDQESQFAWSILCADALLGFHNILKSVLWMLTCDHVMILWLGPNFTICDTEEGADNTK